MKNAIHLSNPATVVHTFSRRFPWKQSKYPSQAVQRTAPPTGILLYPSVGAVFLAVDFGPPQSVPKVHPVPLDKNADASTCLQCHNSGDDREFGGTGAAGPHGLANLHILERNYQFSQAAVPGGTVTNLPNPDLSMAGPYSMCAKCHDLNQIMANTGFTQHSFHVSQYGFTCSTCHTAHGMGSTSPTVTGREDGQLRCQCGRAEWRVADLV